ncbi:acyl-CoA/acyl-ACP dehydrogenase [Streptacidiphilus sp. ASG 303]|uniref:acyl-CoA dehydrogenase family protein n=1 Tax=Streptacidiphilus sp. ASG 303 TaxID=2896847 RepID=UPI001E417729|nr:acyl-CoA dehydrogenase family protein [Streptacidiphilus sp. ASG 303]MCD0482573.1 acyl-CoA/acyl-ACP dehydrogenase [Streptacidiphilus sp. ASG 303]
MTTPDLLYSEVEEDLRASVRALLADRCPPAAVLARAEGPAPYDGKLWHALARELGAAGLQVPEEHGGAGATLRETAVVLEELGRAAAPTPFLGSAVLATTALLACAGGAELLAELAAGERTAALAVPLAAAPGTGFPWAGLPQTVRADGAGALTGRVAAVADAAAADVLLVPAAGPDGPGLYAVEADAAGLAVAPRTSLDLTRPLADLALHGVPARRLAGPAEAPAAVERALLTGAGLLASEQLGIAEWCLATTTAYLKERRQFGRPVGSFQAVKHRLADLWLEAAGARAAARGAADALARGAEDAPLAVAVAQAYCGDAAVRAAEECVQLHGGIGMTWEHPAHLYLKRAKADQIALGTPGRHRAALAVLADLPAPTG